MIFSKKFIQRTNVYTTFDNFVPAPYLRKHFFVKTSIKKAQILICGLGFYELYVNGKNITKGLLAPYISNPDEKLYYDLYDISHWLNEGENCIGILLGNGFLNNPGGNIWGFDTALFRDAPKVALSLCINDELYFEADETFKTADSPIIFDDYRIGEWYDARKEIANWNEVGFIDEKWENAIYATPPKGAASVCNADPIRVEKEMPPIEIIKTEAGWVYKFSENNAGVCKLKIFGKEGQKIVLTYGEVLHNGELDLRNIKFADRSPNIIHKDIYFCKGGEEEYTPKFTYHGFQYVLVEGIIEEQATKELLTYMVFHSDIPKSGTFECSSWILNRIQENVYRSDLASFHYFPTDCPQREKNGWTGDIAISAEQIMLNLHAENSFAEWLNCLRATQNESGVYPSIIPTTGWGYNECNGPAWAAALIQATYYGYKYSGDKKILQDNFSAIMKYLHYAHSRRGADGLLQYGLGDWVQPDRPAGRPDASTKITDSLIILDWLHKTKLIMNVLNEFNEISFVENFYADLKESFRKAYIENGRIKEPNDNQTSIAMAIYYHAVNEDEKENALKQLVEKIAQADGHFATGVLGGRVIYRVLAKCGYENLAYDMITKTSYPSYAHQVLNGATTLWETFVDFDEKGEPKTGYSSLNHHFWGDISAWFYKYLGGININPSLKDPYLIEVKPKYVEGIDYVSIEKEYLGEMISVKWKRKGSDIDLKVKASEKFTVIT